MPVLARRQHKDTVPWLEGAALVALIGDSDRAFELAAAHGENPWSVLDERAACRLMVAFEDKLLRTWITDHDGAGRRPWSWWRVIATEPRRVVAGEWTPIVGRHLCHDDGQPFGSGTATFETEAAYLERLNLWQRGERARAARREITT